MKLQNILGISAGFHDAAATMIRSDGEILFAGHSERYSKKKNDAMICAELLTEFCEYPIDTIAYYERPWLKQARNFVSGQGIDWSMSLSNRYYEINWAHGCNIRLDR
jgi:carbamoyltransferase